MSGPITSTKFGNRRFFLKTLAAGGACGVLGWGSWKWLGSGELRFEGEIQGAASSVGHKVREALSGEPDEVIEKEVLIAGGGVSGLSAGWWLQRNQFEDFLILDLDRKVGGNAQSGENQVSAYPWGAHYLPLPNSEAVWVKDFLKDIGVIEGFDSAGQPIYKDIYLCADPQDRLLFQGRWQEGLVPQLGISEEDRLEYSRFFSFVEKLKHAKGRDGKWAFAIPLDLSSEDPEFRNWDQISMRDFLQKEGYRSRYLSWYINYCCRDDYGTTSDQVSAWAGLHYFSSRRGQAANADPQNILTWPEGNGFLTKALAQKLAGKIQTETLVYSVQNQNEIVLVDTLHLPSGRKIRYKVSQLIFAGPRFVAGHVIKGLKAEAPEILQKLKYSPWMVANVTLKHRPESSGAPLSWDNVSYSSRSLGYVVATHQKISLFPQETVITSYWPLDDREPPEARRWASERRHEDWARDVAQDLQRMHHGILKDIQRIDVWVWGHGMVQPNPGFIWGEERQKMLQPLGRIHFAHSDMSGISIFEEAQYHGVQAARQVLKLVSKRLI